MTLALYTNSISAHQLPLARELVALVGADNFRYIYTGESLQGGGQEVSVDETWIVCEQKSKSKVEVEERKLKCEVEVEQRNVSSLEAVAKPLFQLGRAALCRGCGRDGARPSRGFATASLRKDEPTTVNLNLQPQPDSETSDLRLRLSTSTSDWLDSADVLLSGIRDVELFERRSAKGLKTFYQSERWFKPIDLKIPLSTSTSSLHLCIPGRLRMLFPRYRRMAHRFVRWANADPNALVLSIGPWAKRDMRRLGVNSEKIVDWGYFVEKSKSKVEVEGGKLKCEVEVEQRNVSSSDEKSKSKVEVEERNFSSSQKDETATIPHSSFLIPHSSPLQLQLSTSTSLPLELELHTPTRILWVGRPLWWKRVDTIRKAVAHVPNATLDVFTSISLAQVREEMRRHDIYVLASNELEGWGAALNEALEEGMTCLGTYEAGASAAMLPKENLFHAGDWKTLAKLLREKSYHHSVLPDAFTPAGAAKKLIGLSTTGFANSTMTSAMGGK